jgi:hypothetical protein
MRSPVIGLWMVSAMIAPFGWGCDQGSGTRRRVSSAATMILRPPLC